MSETEISEADIAAARAAETVATGCDCEVCLRDMGKHFARHLLTALAITPEQK